MKTLIITGGKLEDSFLLQFLEKESFEYVIIVDGALEIANRVGLDFDCLVGDFDTVSKDVLAQYTSRKDILIDQHMPEKDETDTELAIHLAIEKKASHITILGATGGRIDHLIGNIHLMKQSLDASIPCVMVDTRNRIQLLNKATVFHKASQYGTYISFLPYTDCATGICLIGFKYPLNDAILTKGNTLGISNEMVSNVCKLEMETGILICIESCD